MCIRDSIFGVLRKGHKMLLAGPSKAGKSFALIELCISIAEGKPWLGQFNCAQGKVLYINLEPVSYTHLDVYKRQEQGFEPWQRHKDGAERRRF